MVKETAINVEKEYQMEAEGLMFKAYQVVIHVFQFTN